MWSRAAARYGFLERIQDDVWNVPFGAFVSSEGGSPEIQSRPPTDWTKSRESPLRAADPRGSQNI